MCNLQKIPGVGKNMEQHLIQLGYHNIESLKNADPEELYAHDTILHGGQLDRCVLYVYRLAVYFAQTDTPDPEKLKWWRWKD